ncbi:MAG: hypothetical protein WCP34_02060 [Pseudomonadota bacterium]
MARHCFMFCDICNLTGWHHVEARRDPDRNGRNGRRISDGRGWFEGTDQEAICHGWVLTPEGQHVCPVCAKNHHLT